VSQTETRNAPVPDWGFTVGEGGVPSVIEEMQTVPRETPQYIRKVKITNDFFIETGNKPISYIELVKELIPRLGLKDSSVRKTISELLEKGNIIKDKNSLYSLKEEDYNRFKS